jgi:tRNA threonylcarbamoyladenosine biosynthesis protein TsaB
MPIILAIETSQRTGGVALRDAAGQVHVEMLRTAGGGRHDDDLMPAIDRLFTRLSLAPSHLAGGAVGVSIGPGGFTGLRIAISTAKMLAEVTGARLVAVPSALVVAESAIAKISDLTSESKSTGSEIVIALSSKNESAWCTRLKRSNSDWQIVGEAGLHDAGSLDLSNIAHVFADEHLPASLRSACEQAGVPVHEPHFDPAACLRIAEWKLARNQTIDALQILPMYPRPPEAVSLWDKKLQAAKSGKQ